METKTSSIAVKRAGEGKATVVIATLGVKDKDGDVLLPGAFGEQVVPVVGAHEWKMPPIGKARIREVGQEAVADIEFNDTTEGQNWYQALKFDWEHPPARQQYSWGFQVPPTHTHRGKQGTDDVRFLHASDKGEPLPIWEVSPVLVGAGSNTRSLMVKEDESHSMAIDSPSQESRGVEAEHPPIQITEVPDHGSDVKRLISPHTTATDDRPWNFAIEHRAVKPSLSGGFYRNLFAVQDAGKEDRRASYRYLHHRVTTDGSEPPASVIACAQILHVLHKGLVPPDERQAVYAHMAQHLRDAGHEPPALGDSDSYVYPYDEEAKLFLWYAEDYLLQTSSIHDWRAKKGQTLKEPQIERFKAVDEKFQALRLLLSLKGLDRPFSELVEHMTVEARGEAVATRMQQVAEKIQHDATAAEREMTASVIARLLPKLH